MILSTFETIDWANKRGLKNFKKNFNKQATNNFNKQATNNYQFKRTRPFTKRWCGDKRMAIATPTILI